jgi:filamentous hemagglutinin
LISKLLPYLFALLLILPQAAHGYALPHLPAQHTRHKINIASLQDTSTYASKQASISVSGTYGYGSSATITGSQTSINGNYASVTEQSGLKAGDGGFQIKVKGNTDLKGAVIEASDAAIKDNKNTLSTATLTTSEIHNRSDYDALSVSVSAGTGGVGAPMALNASDKDESNTRSGISGAVINITDDKKQKELTGKKGEATVASLNRDVATGKDTSGAIGNNLDVAEVQASLTVTQTFVQQANTYIATKSQQADQASAALKKELAKPEAQRDQALIEQANQTLQDNATWGMGGTGRTILTAITAAAGGNVTGGASQMVQAATVNYLQSLGVQEIKQIADNLKDSNGQPNAASEAVRTALQGIAGCAGASAQGASCGSAALGASASVVLSNLMSDPQGLTAEQKDTRKNLISGLITSVTAATGGDAAIANTASQIELENNSEFSRMRGAIVATIQSAAERSRSFKTREPTKSELLAVMKDLSAQLRRTDLNADEQQGLHALWMNLNDLGQHYKILDASNLPPEMYSIGMASMALSGGGNIAVKSVGVTVPKLPRTQSEFVPVSTNASLRNASGNTEASANGARNQPYGNVVSAQELSVAGNNERLDLVTINKILATEKPNRPEPNTYFSPSYIDNELMQFDGGVTKILKQTPSSTRDLGPPGGTFVMPNNVANDIINQTGGNPFLLEQRLGLNPGDLGRSPVRIDITSPIGLRMPSGNEMGANNMWLPGGLSSGGVPEATINPVKAGSYIVTPILNSSGTGK